MNAPQNFASLGPKLLAQGFEPIPVAGKRPVVKKWEDLELHPDRVATWAANGKGDLNVGIRTSALAPIDVDIYDAEVASRVVAAARARFGDAPERVGMPPKALLLYAAIEPGTKITSPIWVSPDGREHRVEVLGIGQQFVAAGIHPDTQQPYTWEGENIADLERWMLTAVDRNEVAAWIRDELPTLMPPEWVQKGAGSAGALVGGEDGLDSVAQKTGLTIEECRWVLDRLPAHRYDDYDKWLRLIFAVHHEFSDMERADDALEMVDDWSRKSVKFVTGVVSGQWEKAKRERAGGLTTMRTVLHWLLHEDGFEGEWKAYQAQRKAAASAAVVVAQEWAARIHTADAVTLKGAIAAEIRAAELSEIDREILVSHIKRRLTALEGAAPGVAAVRKLLAPPKARIESDDVELGDALSLAPAWAQPWVWDAGADCYVHRVTKETRTVVSFNAAFSRHVADLFLGDEKPVTPHEAMTCHWRVPVVSGQMYYPAASGDIFTFEGRSYLNAYRADLRVEPDAKVTEEGRQLRKALERQFELLIPDMRERALLRYWLAHNYLHPGRKIRWAPVIKGCEGDGKTTVLSLLMPVLGGKNAQILNGGTVLGSAFTGWAEGSAVTIVEEIRFQGENKYEVANRMKPYITNDCVEVRALYKDQRVVLNTTNYGFTTNHVDMLPINDADRRYFILHSPFEKKEEVEAALRSRYGIPMEEHFAELNDLPSAHPGQLALWLAESEAPAEFKANGTAPVTAAREVTILASHENDLDDQVRRILEAGADGVHDYEAKVALDAWKLAPDREDLRKEAERACSLAGWPPLPAANDEAGWKIFERERSARGIASLRLGIGPDAVAFDLLKDELNSLRKAPTGRQAREALRAAGFVPLPAAQSRGSRAKQVKWNGSRYSVWVRPHLIDVDDARARAELSRTTPEPFD
ncbi:DUF5906 domain-containing protein [Thauera butanivorans]|uniref:DUF5906 domain-containing protein n=1 Tax=Thauera butanivorans TaxID=86174 RepID=UPI003AB903A9